MVKTKRQMSIVAILMIIFFGASDVFGVGKKSDVILVGSGDVLKSEFEAKLLSIVQLYNQILYPGELPLRFEVEADSDGDPHAFRLQDFRGIAITKGFLENKKLTADGQIMTLCHEIGHHFGGAPKKSKTATQILFQKETSPFSWSSAEGQADYYAAAKCAKLVFGFDALSLQPLAKDTPPIVRNLCDQAYNQEIEQRICYRINIAGLNMLESYNTERETFSFSLKAAVLKEYGLVEGHSNKQCRLDTILAGSLCKMPATAKPDDQDPDNNYCLDNISRRPRCWYNPSF